MDSLNLDRINDQEYFISYQESSNPSVMFTLDINIVNGIEYAELYINAKGSGLRLFEGIISLLKQRTVEGKRVSLVFEPTTLDGWNFLRKLRNLGYEFYASTHPFQSGVNAYILDINPII